MKVVKHIERNERTLIESVRTDSIIEYDGNFYFITNTNPLDHEDLVFAVNLTTGYCKEFPSGVKVRVVKAELHILD